MFALRWNYDNTIVVFLTLSGGTSPQNVQRIKPFAFRWILVDGNLGTHDMLYLGYHVSNVTDV